MQLIRGHLLAKMLGGSGKLKENLVALVQNPVNSPLMRDIEQEVYNRVNAGEVIEYTVLPIYHSALDQAPSAIKIIAKGDKGTIIEETLYNNF